MLESNRIVEEDYNSCQEKINMNKAMLDQFTRSSRNYDPKELLHSHDECTDEQKLELKLQNSLIKGMTKTLKAALFSAQEKLKTKYFFGSVLSFLKFLSDYSR